MCWEACESIWLLLHSYAHLSAFQASTGPVTVLLTVCVWVWWGDVHVCVLGFVWVINSVLACAVSHAVCDTEAWEKENKKLFWSQLFRCHLSSCCWSWEFVSISFPLWEYKKVSVTPYCCSAAYLLMHKNCTASLLERGSEGPPLLLNAFSHMHTWLTDHSSPLKLFCVISQLYITPALILVGYFHPGKCNKTCRNITHS